MADVVDKATRSRMMSGIRAKNTAPELYVRQRLHAKGFRFRLHAKDIPGKPDIVLPKHNALIQVHGCFWHGHGCKQCKTPATNTEFWQEKISSNQQRDNQNLCKQKENGWRTLVIWECAIRLSIQQKASFDLIESIGLWLNSNNSAAHIDTAGLHSDI